MTEKRLSLLVGFVWWTVIVNMVYCEEPVTRTSVLNPIYLIKGHLVNSSNINPESNSDTEEIIYSSDAYFTDTTESIGNFSDITSRNFVLNDTVSDESYLPTTDSSAIMTDVPGNKISTPRVRTIGTKDSPSSTSQVSYPTSPSRPLNEDVLNSVNFLRLMERNCTVAYLEVKYKEELPVIKEKTSESCIVGFWHRGIFPLWLHQVSGEGLLDTLPRASDEQRNTFTEQLCPCQSVQVSKSCGQKVVDAILPLIYPCFEEKVDSSDSSDKDAQIIAKVKKAMKDIQLFNEAKLKLRQTQEMI